MNFMDIDGYKAAIHYDPDTRQFRGEFIELSGSADFYGEDMDTLHKEGESSLRVFLDMCEEKGIEPRRNSLAQRAWDETGIDLEAPQDQPPEPTPDLD